MTWALSFWTGTSPYSPIWAHLPNTSDAPAPGAAFGRHHRVLRARCSTTIKNRQIHRARNPRLAAPRVLHRIVGTRRTRGRPGTDKTDMDFRQTAPEIHVSLVCPRLKSTISPPLRWPPALCPLRSTCLARRARDSAVDDRAPVAGARPRWAPDCPAPVSRPE